MLTRLMVRTSSISVMVLGTGLALGQNYPNKPIRVIVPYGPGGGGDVLSRVIGQRLTEIWGQQIVVDNRGGGGAVIGTDMAAKAVPDGYTLLLTNTAHAINPALLRTLPYDSINDFAPVSLIAKQPNLLVANSALPVRGVNELIALAKSKPGSINYASVGIGSSAHLVGELFSSKAGIQMTHVPYKGTAAAATDVISGQVQIMFPPVLAIWPHVQSGRLRALAVTSPKRSTLAPEVPTVAESGLPGYEATAWYLMLAPARTPKPIVAKLNAEIDRALQDPDAKERITRGGADPAGGSPAQAADFLRREITLWGNVIKVAKITPK